MMANSFNTETNAEEITLSRADLLQLVEDCSAFINKFSTWKHPVNTKDIAFLNEGLTEYKDLIAKAVGLRILRIEGLSSSVWPGQEATISEDGKLRSLRKSYREEGGDWHRKAEFKIPAENLPRFFEGAARFVRNHAETVLDASPFKLERNHQIRKNGLVSDRGLLNYEIV